MNDTVGTTDTTRCPAICGVTAIVARGAYRAAPAIGFLAGAAATSLAALSTVAVLYTGVLGSIVGVAVRDALSRPPLV